MGVAVFAAYRAYYSRKLAVQRAMSQLWLQECAAGLSFAAPAISTAKSARFWLGTRHLVQHNRSFEECSRPVAGSLQSAGSHIAFSSSPEVRPVSQGGLSPMECRTQ